MGIKTKNTISTAMPKRPKNLAVRDPGRYAFGIGTSVAVVVFSVIIARTSFKRLAKKISSSFA